eukprot:gene18418-28414_t
MAWAVCTGGRSPVRDNAAQLTVPCMALDMHALLKARKALMGPDKTVEAVDEEFDFPADNNFWQCLQRFAAAIPEASQVPTFHIESSHSDEPGLTVNRQFLKLFRQAWNTEFPLSITVAMNEVGRTQAAVFSAHSAVWYEVLLRSKGHAAFEHRGRQIPKGVCLCHSSSDPNAPPVALTVAQWGEICALWPEQFPDPTQSFFEEQVAAHVTQTSSHQPLVRLDPNNVSGRNLLGETLNNNNHNNTNRNSRALTGALSVAASTVNIERVEPEAAGNARASRKSFRALNRETSRFSEALLHQRGPSFKSGGLLVPESTDDPPRAARQTSYVELLLKQSREPRPRGTHDDLAATWQLTPLCDSVAGTFANRGQHPRQPRPSSTYQAPRGSLWADRTSHRTSMPPFPTATPVDVPVEPDDDDEYLHETMLTVEPTEGYMGLDGVAFRPAAEQVRARVQPGDEELPYEEKEEDGENEEDPPASEPPSESEIEPEPELEPVAAEEEPPLESLMLPFESCGMGDDLGDTPSVRSAFDDAVDPYLHARVLRLESERIQRELAAQARAAAADQEKKLRNLHDAYVQLHREHTEMLSARPASPARSKPPQTPHPRQPTTPTAHRGGPTPLDHVQPPSSLSTGAPDIFMQKEPPETWESAPGQLPHSESLPSRILAPSRPGSVAVPFNSSKMHSYAVPPLDDDVRSRSSRGFFDRVKRFGSAGCGQSDSAIVQATLRVEDPNGVSNQKYDIPVKELASLASSPARSRPSSPPASLHQGILDIVRANGQMASLPVPEDALHDLITHLTPAPAARRAASPFADFASPDEYRSPEKVSKSYPGTPYSVPPLIDAIVSPEHHAPPRSVARPLPPLPDAAPSNPASVFNHDAPPRNPGGADADRRRISPPRHGTPAAVLACDVWPGLDMHAMQACSAAPAGSGISAPASVCTTCGDAVFKDVTNTRQPSAFKPLRGLPTPALETPDGDRQRKKHQEKARLALAKPEPIWNSRLGTQHSAPVSAAEGNATATTSIPSCYGPTAVQSSSRSTKKNKPWQAFANVLETVYARDGNGQK